MEQVAAISSPQGDTPTIQAASPASRPDLEQTSLERDLPVVLEVAEEASPDNGRRNEEVTAAATSRVTEATPASKSKSNATWAPGEDEVEQAKKLDRDTAAGCREGKWMSIWHTKGKDLSMYGAGIHLQFGFGLGFSRVIWFCAVAGVPFLAFNLTGKNLENGGYVPESLRETYLEYVSWTAVPNMGKVQEVDGVTKSRGVSFIDVFGWGPYLAEDVGYGVSIVDAFCMLLVFGVALWYELRVIPHASEDHRYTEAFSVYVDKLPRRLPGEEHRRYKELLEKHFEQLLRAEIDGIDLRKVAAGRKVVLKEDKGSDDYPRERWCGSKLCPYRYSARDGKGRMLGKIVKSKEGNLQVEWRPEKGDDGKYPKPQRTDFKPDALLDQAMLKRIEYQTEAGNFVPEAKMVHEVSLVRDFGGQLGALRAKAQKTKDQRSEADALVEVKPDKAAELQTKLQEEAQEHSQKAQEAHEALQNALVAKDKKELNRLRKDLDLPIEDRDVVGAYVVFNRRRNRNFVFDEYRFGRTWMRLFQRKQLLFGGRSIRVNEATDPSEVFWEHMDCPMYSKVLRTSLVVLITLLLVCFSVGFFASAKHVANVAKEYGGTETCNATQVYTIECLVDTDCECSSAGLLGVINDQPAGVKACCTDWLDAQYQATSATLGASFAPVVLNLVIGYVINFLANFTKSHTLTSTNQGIVLMTTVMQLVNIVVSVIVVNADFGSGWRGWVDETFGGMGFGSDNFPLGCGSYATLTPAWYAEVGATIAFSLAISAITIPMAMPMSYFIHLVFKKLFFKRARSSEQLYALFVRPIYNLALISAQDAVMIIACITFAAGMPILWPVLALYLSLSYLAKKYTFLRGSKEPPHFSHHLSRMMVGYAQVAVALHCAFAVWVFSEPESLPSHVENYGWDLGDIHNILSRVSYQSTHPAFVILLFVLAVVVLRLVFFIVGNVGFGMAVAIARMLANSARVRSESACCSFFKRCGCASRAFAATTTAGAWIATCVADFSKAVEDTVLHEAFDQGPRELFQKKRIPWSYCLENNDEYKVVFCQTGSRSGSKDDVPSTAESSGEPSGVDTL